MIQTVNEMLEYLIKHSDEIADMVVCYTTDEHELVVSSNTSDVITSLGMMSYAKEIMLNQEYCEKE